MALLRPGRWGSRPQGGCLQHRTEAQRQPKGQQACGRDARAPRAITPPLRGSRRSRAVRRRLMRWGVSAGRLLRKPTCTLWETPVCPRAGPPPCRGDHSRKNGRSLMKVNHEWTRRQMDLLQPQAAPKQFCALGVTMSWDFGSAGVPPAPSLASLGHLPHLDQPGTAPWLSFGLADAVPADRVAACSIALKLSGSQRDSMRAGRPRSQGNHSPLEGESQKPSRQAKADAVGGERRELLRMPTCTLWETPVCPRAGRPPCRAEHSRKNGRSLMKMNHEWTRRHEDR